MILGAAVRLLTPQIVIHATHVGSNWVAYPTYPPIRVLLCLHPEEIWEWLDLDFARWRRGFDTMEDVYRWIVGGAGVLNAAWRKIQRRDPLVGRCGGSGKRRNIAWKAFCTWIEEGDLEFDETTEEHEECGRRNKVSPGQVNVDPDRPNVIHGLLGRALDRWGKRDVMEQAWERQRKWVRLAWNRKRAKEWARERKELAKVAGGGMSLLGVQDNQPLELKGGGCT
jgi:hypothetical protein